MAEELQGIINNLWIGNFQAGINEANSIKSSNEEYKNVLLYRCYLGLKNYELLEDEIPDSASPSLLAVKLFAYYLQQPSKIDSLLDKLKTLSSDTADFVAASILANENRFEEALRAISTLTSLEARGLMIHCLLKINRVDKASEILTKLQQQDDDSIVTQLSTAWIALAKGGEAMKEALFIYQDLVDKYSGTSKLLNGLAVCNLKMNKYEEAQTLLMEALEKNPNDPETLSNLILVSPFVNPEKSQVETTRRLKQLRSSSPNNAFIKSLDQFEESFNRNAARYAAAN